MRILFFGNHTVGVQALTALRETEDIVGVVAHPVDPEDGLRYLSVYDFALRNGWRARRSHGKDPGLETFIRSIAPDLIWITDYRYLLSQELLSLAPHGAVNLHPSLLPKYRGRAPINWAIINGESILGLTAHCVDGGMDTGDVIEQLSFTLLPEQDVGDALKILYPLYGRISRAVVEYLRAGKLPRRQQDHSQASVFPRRKPEDGRIDWNMPLRSVWNLVRAVAYPYPGAFTTVDGGRLIVWKAAPAAYSTNPPLIPGTVLRCTDGVLHVQCHDDVLMLTSVELIGDGHTDSLSPGVVLGR